MPRKIIFSKSSDVPNSKLPGLLCRRVLPPHAARKARRFRQVFDKNGWTGVWTDTIYDYTHFHSNAHEVLAIAEGCVTVRLGGEQGRNYRLSAGDMLVLPAGTGHRRISRDDDLKVVGAYPPGQGHFNMKRKGLAIPKVPLPLTDPFYGVNGPVVRAWKGKRTNGSLLPKA
jgi:uncharacterized protein YjlB